MKPDNRIHAGTMKYLTAKETAAYLKMSPRTLETLRWKGGGPPFAKLSPGRSGRVLYDREAVDRWVAERTQSSTTED